MNSTYSIPQHVWRVEDRPHPRKKDEKNEDGSVLMQHFSDVFAQFQLKLVKYNRVPAHAAAERKELHAVLDDLLYLKSLL
jgi:hypothetical protein